MANETLLDGQLHSSGPKMIHFTKLDQVTFTATTTTFTVIVVSILLSLHSLCSRTKTVNSNWLGTKEKQGATLSIIIFKSKILFNLIETTKETKTKLGNI